MTTSKSARFVALDGLRGYAAVIVVLHHCLLLAPAAAEAYRPGGHAHGAAGVLAYTPLHLFWAGTEAVYVFFVLSGFVLALPFLGRSRPSWVAYFPRRLLRLYVPMAGSVVLAVALFFAVDRHHATGSWWLIDYHPADFHLRSVAYDASLYKPGAFNTVWWSLRYEVAFSLLLPAYVWLVLALRRVSWLLAPLSVATAACGAALGNTWLQFLPVFMIGVVLAQHRARVVAVARRLSPAGWWATAAVLTLLLTVRWWTGGPEPLVFAGAVVGASGVLVAFLAWPRAVAMGESRTGRHLGRLSFSLYLVHEPILVTVAFAFPTLSWVAIGLVGVTLSFLVAALFFRFVEGPSQGLASWAGRKVRRRVEGRGPRVSAASG